MALFARKKSGHQAHHGIGPQEEEPNTPRIRNRLSKPRSLNTNLRPSSSLQALSSQNAASRSEVAVVEPTAQSESTDNPVTNSRVSDLIGRIEANQKSTSSPSYPSVSLPKRGESCQYALTSIPETAPPKICTKQSKDKITSLKNDSRTSISPAASFDDTTMKNPFSRRSSFLPGTATRKDSAAEYIHEAEEDEQDTMPHVAMAYGNKQEHVHIDDDARSFDEGDDWLPTPQHDRPETPRSLINYTHLGGMSLGSLHIVNGRTSPTPSNTSKQLFARRPGARDTSSEYAESVYDDQTLAGSLNGGSVYSTRNKYRDFSWRSHGSSQLRDPQTPPLPGLDTHSDPASFLASEYMAELPPSPFPARKSSLSSFSNRAASAGFEPSDVMERSPSVRSFMSYESGADNEAELESSNSSVRSATGTILITTSKPLNAEDDLFDDEGLGQSPSNERETPEFWQSLNMPAVSHADTHHDEQHTVPGSQLIQPIEPGNRGPQLTVQIAPGILHTAQLADFRALDSRGFESSLGFVSPIQLEPLSVHTPTSSSPEPQKSFHTSDSGYSSNVSLRSSLDERKKSTSDVERRSLVDKVFRPILKSRRTSVEVMAVKSDRTTPSRTSTAVPDPVEVVPSPVDPEKRVRRLTKRFPSAKQIQPVVLQTIQSIDDLSIPPVSLEASEHLHHRVLAVPNLETTFRSMDHVRNRHSVSTVGGFDEMPEIRFPSPEPENAKKQRRRSWFGKVKDDKPKPSKRDSRTVSGISQEHAMAIMNDWDVLAPSLNASRYDQSSSRRNSLKQNSIKVRQRFTMDDKTAAELARYRSSSIRERDNWDVEQTVRPRRSVSGKKSRNSSIASRKSSAPRASLNHRQCDTTPSVMYDSPVEYIPEPQAGPPPPPPHSPRPQSIQEDYSSPPHPARAPPPPPPHSPQPSSLNHEDYFAYSDSHIHASEDFAPPPPSHSPRPMDLTPDEIEQDPWAAHASAWKQRRDRASSPYRQEAWAFEDETAYPARHEYSSTLRTPPRLSSLHSQYSGEQSRHYGKREQRHTLDVYSGGPIWGCRDKSNGEQRYETGVRPSWEDDGRGREYILPWNGYEGCR